jgi:hypothetical protein
VEIGDRSLGLLSLVLKSDQEITKQSPTRLVSDLRSI